MTKRYVDIALRVKGSFGMQIIELVETEAEDHDWNTPSKDQKSYLILPHSDDMTLEMQIAYAEKFNMEIIPRESDKELCRMFPVEHTNRTIIADESFLMAAREHDFGLERLYHIEVIHDVQ